MKVDEDGNQTEEVELEIDGVVFKKLPYVDKDFSKYFKSFFFQLQRRILTYGITCSVLDDEEQEVINLSLEVGGAEVFKADHHETWSHAMFIQRLLKTYGDDLVKDLVISEL